MRRTRARLEQLRRHLDRVKWRDKQAEETYWTLVLAQKPSPPCASIAALDSVLKEYYNAEKLEMMMLENSMLHFFTSKAKAMTKYLSEERFIVQSNDKQSLRNYAEGWDRTFGEKEPEAAPEEPVVSCVGCGVVLEPEPRAPCCEDCYHHDPACAKLCTEGAECDCGWG